MNHSKRFVCLAAVSLGLQIAASAAAQPSDAPPPDRRDETEEGLVFFDTGPLRIRDQFLLSSGFLVLDPVSADVLAPGRWQIDVVASVTNAFAHSGSVEDFLQERSERGPLTLEQLQALDQDKGSGKFFVDGELYRTAIAVRRGITERLQLEVLVPILNFQGGVLDGAVEGFHDLFQLGQAGRLGVPRNRFTVYFETDDRLIYQTEAPGVGIGDIILGAKVALPSPSKAWHLAAEAKVELPTGDEEALYGSGSLDLGLQFLATHYFERSCLHLGAAATHLGSSDIFGTDEQLTLSGLVGYERALGSSLSLVLQATVSQSPFADLDIEGLDAQAVVADIGFKKGFGARRVLFVALSENLVNFDNTPDVGLHVGMTQMF